MLNPAAGQQRGGAPRLPYSVAPHPRSDSDVSFGSCLSRLFPCTSSSCTFPHVGAADHPKKANRRRTCGINLSG
jgi:hypothetical protein